MNSRDLFKKTHSAYESRQVFDGAYAVSARESGQVAGACASLKAICSPDATDQDLWHVVHLDAGSRLLLDSVAVLGASGQDQAAEWAMQDFGQHMGAVGVIGVASGSAIALRRVLDDGLQRGRVTQALLDSAGSRVTAHPVRWLDGVGIASHGGSMATLFLDMVRHDEDGLLLDAMTPADLMEGAEQGQFDALIVDYAHLEMLQNRLAAALSKVAANGLSVSGVTATKPFKRNGVAQVAVMFDFSDGQTFTAFFHNPDSTPAKLAPKDILTSWKFTLNKRDVTAVVQPEQGENVQMPKLASRIMQLVAKNSDRFKRANARKGEMAAQVQEVQARIDQKQAQLTELESDIADLQGRIDERLKAKPASAESGGMASPTNNGKAEEWHTEVPTEGLPELKEEKKKFYDFRLVINRLADDAVKAITRTQKLGNVSLYAYYMPSIPNTGRHGIVRLFPDDQTPGGSWKLLDPQVFHAGMVSDDQIRARLIEPLSKAPVLAHSQQGGTGNGAVSGGSSENPDGLTDAEMVVLISTRGYKPKFRYDAARKETSTNRRGDDGISKDQYNAAVDSLNAKGKYLKRSAITDDGQNLVNSFMPELNFVDKKLAYFAGKFAASEQPEMTDAKKIELVDKAYKFASATDEFKLFAADSQIQDADDLTSLSVQAEYDPLSTAVAMDKAAKKNGFSVNWQIFTEAGMDDELMARIYNGRKQIGRISMGGDGKAMVYVGASGDTRVTTPDGIRAVFSDDDAPYMIDWLANSLSEQAASQPGSTKPAAAPKANKKFDAYISIAADSIDNLRLNDIDRVLDQASSRDEMLKLAIYMVSKRPSIRDSVIHSFKSVLVEKHWNRAFTKTPTPPSSVPENSADAMKHLKRLFNAMEKAGVKAAFSPDGSNALRFRVIAAQRDAVSGHILMNRDPSQNVRWGVDRFRLSQITNEAENNVLQIVKDATLWLNGELSEIHSNSFLEDPEWAAESPLGAKWQAEIVDSARVVQPEPASESIAAPTGDGLSKDASEAIDNMLLALEADQQLMGRIEQAASRMDITDVSGDMVESWYRANSITYLSSLPMTQLMKAADEFKRQAVETVNRIGTVYGMSDRELYLLAMYLGYAEGTARNPDAVTKKALGEHPADLDKAFAKLKKSPKPQQDDQEAQAVNPPTQEPAMNPDLDYLQSIVNGDADLSDGEAVEAELERIGENLAPELEALFEQAVDAYAAYQVQQASKVA